MLQGYTAYGRCTTRVFCTVPPCCVNGTYLQTLQGFFPVIWTSLPLDRIPLLCGSCRCRSQDSCQYCRSSCRSCVHHMCIKHPAPSETFLIISWNRQVVRQSTGNCTGHDLSSLCIGDCGLRNSRLEVTHPLASSRSAYSIMAIPVIPDNDLRA